MLYVATPTACVELLARALATALATAIPTAKACRKHSISKKRSKCVLELASISSVDYTVLI